MDVLKLFMLKIKLRKYKRGSKSYKKIDIYNNWYQTHGIPDLQLEIENLERQIKIKKLGNKMVQKFDE